MKLLKRLASSVSVIVLAFSSLTVISFTGVAQAAAGSDTCVWTGAGGNANFSTAGNWSSCSSGAPVTGDTLKFAQLSGDTTSSIHTINNDLNTNVRLAGVLVDATSQTANVTSTYYFNGTALNFSDGATFTATNANGNYGAIVSLPSFHVYGDITIGDDIGSTIKINSSWTVDGDLTVEGYPYFDFGLGATVSGQLIIDTQSQVTVNARQLTASSIDVADGSTLTFGTSGSSEDTDQLTSMSMSAPITLNGGTLAVNASSIYDGSSYASANTTYTLSGDITLTADSNITAGTKATVNLTGTINKNGHRLNINTYNAGTILINGDAYRNDPKTTVLSDSKPTCTYGDSSGCYTVVDNETATLDGVRGAVSVMHGGTLNGTGTTNNLSVNDGAIVAPGHSPGKLTVLEVLTLSEGSTYQAEIQNKDSYDQLQVGANYTGTDKAVSLSNANLALSLYDGYKINANDSFTIIDNRSSTAVDGTFKGLPEGATIKVNDGVFKISYVGGDGNDVVLTVVTIPTTPDTGFADLSASPMTTLLGTLVVASGLALVATKLRKHPARR